MDDAIITTIQHALIDGDRQAAEKAARAALEAGMGAHV